ncbi:MAG: hypothetical protein D6679_07490 [Candidatus Hydrogenedentota bacterium]|nr:MAG: hypothetical protein D6679_07490 [Candidatus Hydrogenedentota bacterium]
MAVRNTAHFRRRVHEAILEDETLMNDLASRLGPGQFEELLSLVDSFLDLYLQGFTDGSKVPKSLPDPAALVRRPGGFRELLLVVAQRFGNGG